MYGGGAKCAVCTKSVYAADPQVKADAKVFHATCFTCKECKSQITLAKWAQLEGENFCKPCFKKVFMLRGKYSDVAGAPPKVTGKASVEKEAEPPSAAAAPPPAPVAEAPKAPTPAKAAPAAATPGESKYGGGSKCDVCSKSVYFSDPKISADGKVWHASCFKCLECKQNITLQKWAQLEGKNFCKPCFNKVFSLRGKYDDVKTGVHAPVKVAGITESEPVATISKTESAPEAPVEPAPEAPVESAPEAPVEPTPEAPAADAQASE